MIFQDESAWAGLDELNESNTGFRFDPIGPARSAELAATHDHYLGLYPPLRALWRSRPTQSELSLYQAD
jgi:hypothetical protein